MADEGLCCSSALVSDVEESVLLCVSHSVTSVPCGSLCKTGGIEKYIHMMLSSMEISLGR